MRRGLTFFFVVAVLSLTVISAFSAEDFWRRITGYSVTTSCGTLDCCQGDFCCDGDVDGTDGAIIKKDFGRNSLINPCTLENPCNGNFDGDLDVDGTDFALFKEDYGRSSAYQRCPTTCYQGESCSSPCYYSRAEVLRLNQSGYCAEPIKKDEPLLVYPDNCPPNGPSSCKSGKCGYFQNVLKCIGTETNYNDNACSNLEGYLKAGCCDLGSGLYIANNTVTNIEDSQKICCSGIFRDECGINASLSHYECVNQRCDLVSGAGINNCTSDSQCIIPRYNYTVCSVTDEKCVKAECPTPGVNCTVEKSDCIFGDDSKCEIPDEIARCVDSDGGSDYAIKGSIKLYNEKNDLLSEHTDRCDSSEVVEFYCENETNIDDTVEIFPREDKVPCSPGYKCDNGACKQEEDDGDEESVDDDSSDGDDSSGGGSSGGGSGGSSSTYYGCFTGVCIGLNCNSDECSDTCDPLNDICSQENICGNMVCDTNETYDNCCIDCGCNDKDYCLDGSCVPNPNSLTGTGASIRDRAKEIQECLRCGEGFWNYCDKKECENLGNSTTVEDGKGYCIFTNGYFFFNDCL